MSEINYDNLEYAEEVNDNLICPICKCPLIDPLYIEACGHTFCRKCILASVGGTADESWLKDCKCPLDRQQFEANELKSVPRVVQTMLNELMVYCPRKPDGCSAILKRTQLEHHLIAECDIKHSAMDTQGRGAEGNEITNLKMQVQSLQNELRDAKTCIASLEERLSSLTFCVDNNIQTRDQETIIERLSHDVQVLLTEQGQTRNDLNLLFSILSSLKLRSESENHIQHWVKELLSLKIEVMSMKSASRSQPPETSSSSSKSLSPSTHENGSRTRINKL